MDTTRVQNTPCMHKAQNHIYECKGHVIIAVTWHAAFHFGDSGAMLCHLKLGCPKIPRTLERKTTGAPHKIVHPYGLIVRSSPVKSVLLCQPPLVVSRTKK